MSLRQFSYIPIIEGESTLKETIFFQNYFFPSSFLWLIFKLPTWWHLLGTVLIQSNLGDNGSPKSYSLKTSSLSNTWTVVFSNDFDFFFSVKIFAWLLNRKIHKTQTQVRPVLGTDAPKSHQSRTPAVNCKPMSTYGAFVMRTRQRESPNPDRRNIALADYLLIQNVPEHEFGSSQLGKTL